MQTPRSNHASCVNGSKIFFVGGRDSNQALLNSLEWYDLVSGERSELHKVLERPIEFPLVGRISEAEIAILGGMNDRGACDDLAIYNF